MILPRGGNEGEAPAEVYYSLFSSYREKVANRSALNFI